VPVNNKKIAKYVGNQISSNHVRFIKGKYLRNVRKRCKNDNITIADLIEQDINNFNSKIFEELETKKKVKVEPMFRVKKPKKHRKNLKISYDIGNILNDDRKLAKQMKYELENDEEEDSSSESED
jgi:hypothetical protein